MIKARRSSAGFSLVEVTVAIGIFAFVAVGVVGLLPAGLKLRAESARETRGVLITQELLSSLQSAPDLTEVKFRKSLDQVDSANLLSSSSTDIKSVLLGYPPQTSVPFYYTDQTGGIESAWENGELGDTTGMIETLALVEVALVDPTIPSLYQVTVSVRSPASQPLTAGKPVEFTTQVFIPPSLP